MSRQGERQGERQVVREVYQRHLIEEPASPTPAMTRSPTQKAVVPPPGYQFLPPNYVPIVPVSAINRAAARPGVQEPAPPRPAPILSETTVIVNRAPEQRATEQPTAVVRAPRNGKQQMHASIERLALSLDEMFENLSSPRRSRSRPRRRTRRARSFDFDDESESSECMAPRYRKSCPYARRRRDSGAYRRGYDEDDTYSRTYQTPPPSRRRGASRGRSLSRRRSPTRRGRPSRGIKSDGDIRHRRRYSDDYDSFHDMVRRSLEQIQRRSRSDPVLHMGSRIRALIQKVIKVSHEVIRARRAIQMGGQRGEHNLGKIFAAESKLGELIELESQLANELARYRRSDFDSDDDYFADLQRAEDKIRRLVDVETRLVRELRSWRKGGESTGAGWPGTYTTRFGVRPATSVMFTDGSRPRPAVTISTPSWTTMTGTTAAAPTTTTTSSTSVTPSSSTPTTSSTSASTEKTKSKGSSKKTKSKGSSKKKSKPKKKKSKKSKSKKSKSKKKKSKSKSRSSKSKGKKKKKRRSKSKSKSSKGKKRKRKRRKKKKKK